MSWDGMLMRLPEDVRHMDEVPEEYDFPPVGAPDAVYAALTGALPGQDHSLGKTVYQDGECYVQLSYPEYEDVETIDVYCDGSTDAVRIIQRVCDVLGVRPVDSDTNDIARFGRYHLD